GVTAFQTFPLPISSSRPYEYRRSGSSPASPGQSRPARAARPSSSPSWLQSAFRRHSRRRSFFQAEDGIRGATVTGVQTCALPIFAPIDLDLGPALNGMATSPPVTRVEPWTFEYEGARRTLLEQLRASGLEGFGLDTHLQIGRASCRERV